jgi:hypothetical protein
MRKLERALISAAKRDGMLSALTELQRIGAFIETADDSSLQLLARLLERELRARAWRPVT